MATPFRPGNLPIPKDKTTWLEGLNASPLVWGAGIAVLAAIPAIILKIWIQAAALALLAVGILVLPGLIQDWATALRLPMVILATIWGAILLLLWWLKRRSRSGQSLPESSATSSASSPSEFSTSSPTSALPGAGATDAITN